MKLSGLLIIVLIIFEVGETIQHEIKEDFAIIQYEIKNLIKKRNYLHIRALISCKYGSLKYGSPDYVDTQIILRSKSFWVEMEHRVYSINMADNLWRNILEYDALYVRAEFLNLLEGIDRKPFEETFANLEKIVADSKTEVNASFYYFAMSALAAAVGDDHTYMVWHSGIFENMECCELIGCTYWDHDKKTIFVKNKTSGQDPPYDAPIIKINGKDAILELDKIRALFCLSTDSLEIEYRIALIYLCLYNPFMPFETYMVRDFIGNVTYDPIWRPCVRMKTSVKSLIENSFYGFTIDPIDIAGPSVQYISAANIVTISIHGSMPEIEEFKVQIKDKLQSLPIKDLKECDLVLLDLRNNQGGLIHTKNLVLESIIHDELANILSEITYHRGIDSKPNEVEYSEEEIGKLVEKRLHLKGPKLVVVTNEICYSACIDVTAMIKLFPYTVHIGKETGEFKLRGSSLKRPLPSGLGEFYIASFGREHKQEPIWQKIQKPQIPDFMLPDEILYSRTAIIYWLLKNKHQVMKAMKNNLKRFKKE